MDNRSSGWGSFFFVVALLASTQVAAQDSRGLVCRVYCSETKLRTGIAELSWTPPQTRAVSQPELDVTVFHKGFERGAYQTFGVIKPEARPQPVITRDTKRDTRPIRAFDLRMRVPEQTRSVTRGEVKERIEIENLEPGLVYRFRLRDAGVVKEVKCEAPVCPADMKEVKP